MAKTRQLAVETMFGGFPTSESPRRKQLVRLLRGNKKYGETETHTFRRWHVIHGCFETADGDETEPVGFGLIIEAIGIASSYSRSRQFVLGYARGNTEWASTGSEYSREYPRIADVSQRKVNSCLGNSRGIQATRGAKKTMSRCRWPS
jgi:hypothetical protein